MVKKVSKAIRMATHTLFVFNDAPQWEDREMSNRQRRHDPDAKDVAKPIHEEEELKVELLSDGQETENKDGDVVDMTGHDDELKPGFATTDEEGFEEEEEYLDTSPQYGAHGLLRLFAWASGCSPSIIPRTLTACLEARANAGAVLCGAFLFIGTITFLAWQPIVGPIGALFAVLLWDGFVTFGLTRAILVELDGIEDVSEMSGKVKLFGAGLLLLVLIEVVFNSALITNVIMQKEVAAAAVTEKQAAVKLAQQEKADVLSELQRWQDTRRKEMKAAQDKLTELESEKAAEALGVRNGRTSGKAGIGSLTKMRQAVVDAQKGVVANLEAALKRDQEPKVKSVQEQAAAIDLRIRQLQVVAANNEESVGIMGYLDGGFTVLKTMYQRNGFILLVYVCVDVFIIVLIVLPMLLKLKQHGVEDHYLMVRADMLGVTLQKQLQAEKELKAAEEMAAAFRKQREKEVTDAEWERSTELAQAEADAAHLESLQGIDARIQTAVIDKIKQRAALELTIQEEYLDKGLNVPEAIKRLVVRLDREIGAVKKTS